MFTLLAVGYLVGLTAAVHRPTRRLGFGMLIGLTLTFPVTVLLGAAVMWGDGELVASLVHTAVRAVHGVAPQTLLVERAELCLPGGAMPAAVGPPARRARRPRADLGRQPSPRRRAPPRLGAHRVGRRERRWIRSSAEDVSGYRQRLAHERTRRIGDRPDRPVGLFTRAIGRRTAANRCDAKQNLRRR